MARQQYGGGTSKCLVWLINRSTARLKCKGKGHDTTTTNNKGSPTTTTSSSSLALSPVSQDASSFTSETNNIDTRLELAMPKRSATGRSFYGKHTASSAVFLDTLTPTNTATKLSQLHSCLPTRKEFCKWLDSISKTSSLPSKGQNKEERAPIKETTKKSVKRKLQMVHDCYDNYHITHESFESIPKKLLKPTQPDIVTSDDTYSQQPSSHTSLSLAKAYFAHLDKTELQTEIVTNEEEEKMPNYSTTTSSTSSAIPGTRTRRNINYQCPTLIHEYQTYHDSARSCSIEPLSLHEYACQRWKHFHNKSFFDGFFDE
jgi:hypothetical protein